MNPPIHGWTSGASSSLKLQFVHQVPVILTVLQKQGLLEKTLEVRTPGEAQDSVMEFVFQEVVDIM